MIRQMKSEEIDRCVQVIRDSFMTVADAFGFTQENGRAKMGDGIFKRVSLQVNTRRFI